MNLYAGMARLAAIAAALGLVACGGERATPADLLTVRTLGLAYLEENRLEEAEAEFLRLIELAPEEAIGYANLGLVYMRTGRLEDAETRIGEAIANDPLDPDVRLMLATVYNLTDRADEQRQTLEAALGATPDHVKTLYSLAELHGEAGLDVDPAREVTYRGRVVELAPANVPARLQLIDVLLRTNQADSALAHLEEIRRQIPELPQQAIAPFDSALVLTRAARPDDALRHARAVHNVLRVTQRYQAGFLDLVGPRGPDAGVPLLTFSQDVAIEIQDASAVMATLRFNSATAGAGLDVVSSSTPPDPAERPALAVADFDQDGDDDVYLSTGGRAFLMRNDLGRFTNIAGQAGVSAGGRSAVFADYDNDGHLDLHVAGPNGSVLYRNAEPGRFDDITAGTTLENSGSIYSVVYADLDHEGDLDIYLAGDTDNRYYQNNLDGTFTERSAQSLVAGGAVASRDVAFGDFDGDDDIDLFVVNDGAPNALYSNLRQGQFENVADSVGLGGSGSHTAVAVGDYDNDGALDIFVTGRTATAHAMFRNTGNGTFSRDERSPALLARLQSFVGRDAVFLDFDNDGHLDLAIAGETTDASGTGILLFHNDGTGRFDDATDRLSVNTPAAALAVGDYNEDGDVDLFVATADGRIELLRNDGGNGNRYLNVQLVGLSTGSGKNNHFGIGAKLEVRAGDLYQMRVVTDPMTRIGLGNHLKADVVRVVWSNGVPHNMFFPGSDQDIVEQQTLKGSCGFLYAWNGDEFEFVTDVMWRSALGMPLGIMGGGGSTSYASPQASQEYLKIPGDRLVPRDGQYVLQITEELWEAAYFDEIKLIAVDHPASVEIFVDEKFVPPAPPSLRIFQAGERLIPRSAVDERGTDLLPQLRSHDDTYVSNLTPARYQGITQLHDLILDLTTDDVRDSVVLFLNGWIFPSDASINVAVAQNSDLEVVFPYLDVINARGEWETAVANVSFPAGKNKTVIVDLTGKFLSNDRRVRIRTNMEVYWDHAFFTVGSPGMATVRTTMTPVSADLHHRGFSREFRKGGRYGPHWFDYGDVTTEPKWLQMEGYYTRYGDVLPLLETSDDRYVIMMAGDEVTVRFDASLAPELEPGWTRDFLIYTDGWIKDADLNTATGDAVTPLPFHTMSRYPYPAADAPTDPAWLEVVRQYHTRWVSDRR